MRPTRTDVLMAVAMVMATRSTCNRLQVGCVIAKDGRIISTGYAGAPSGLPHCGPECNPDNPCNNTVHAEAGAIAYAARHGIAVEGATIYCTHSPCLACAKLIINSGIQEVIYDQEYRDKSGVELLLKAGKSVRHVHYIGRECSDDSNS